MELLLVCCLLFVVVVVCFFFVGWIRKSLRGVLSVGGVVFGKEESGAPG